MEKKYSKSAQTTAGIVVEEVASSVGVKSEAKSAGKKAPSPAKKAKFAQPVAQPVARAQPQRRQTDAPARSLFSF